MTADTIAALRRAGFGAERASELAARFEAHGDPADVLRLHTPTTWPTGAVLCDRCDLDWPCDAVLLGREVEALRVYRQERLPMAVAA